MIGSDIKTLKEMIVELLIIKPKTCKEIFNILKKNRPEISIQAIYKQLNSLLKEKVILKQSSRYFISNEWKHALLSLISQENFTLPQAEERFNYTFQSLIHLDAYFKHSIGLIMSVDQKSPILFYCPHQIWPYVPTRYQNEKNIVQRYQERGRNTYLIIGGNTYLDKQYKKIFHPKFFKIEIVPDFLIQRNTHITIIGDIIIYTKLPHSIMVMIDDFYKQITSKEASKEKLKKMIEVLEKKQKGKIIIEHNSKKALQYKKRFEKYFAEIY